MTDKTRLLQEADEAFAALRQAIDGLSDGEMAQVWLGSWSVREILLHISGWHQAMAPAFQRVGRGEEPYPPGTYDDFDAWNARFVTQGTGMKPADVVADLLASRETFMREAAALPEAAFAPGGAARELFEGTGPAHYREHTQQIREWRRAGVR